LALVEGLAADFEFFGGGFEFFEHGGGEIDVDVLDGVHHFAGVGEEARDIFAFVGLAGDGLGGDGFFLDRVFFIEFLFFLGRFRGDVIAERSVHQRTFRRRAGWPVTGRVRVFRANVRERSSLYHPNA
jgi:hypothetical protein